MHHFGNCSVTVSIHLKTQSDHRHAANPPQTTEIIPRFSTLYKIFHHGQLFHAMLKKWSFVRTLHHITAYDL